MSHVTVIDEYTRNPIANASITQLDGETILTDCCGRVDIPYDLVGQQLLIERNHYTPFLLKGSFPPYVKLKPLDQDLYGMWLPTTIFYKDGTSKPWKGTRDDIESILTKEEFQEKVGMGHGSEIPDKHYWCFFFKSNGSFRTPGIQNFKKWWTASHRLHNPQIVSIGSYSSQGMYGTSVYGRTFIKKEKGLYQFASFPPVEKTLYTLNENQNWYPPKDV